MEYIFLPPPPYPLPLSAPAQKRNVPSFPIISAKIGGEAFGRAGKKAKKKRGGSPPPTFRSIPLRSPSERDNSGRERGSETRPGAISPKSLKFNPLLPLPPFEIKPGWMLAAPWRCPLPPALKRGRFPACLPAPLKCKAKGTRPSHFFLSGTRAAAGDERERGIGGGILRVK